MREFGPYGKLAMPLLLRPQFVGTIAFKTVGLISWLG